MAELGWIGMGAIGTPMALRLLAAGHALHVWGRTASRLTPALERGARLASSAAELGARCEGVMICVSDGAAVEEVVFGRAGVVEGNGTCSIVDHSTIEPERTRALAARVRERGLRWVDAPVSGGATGARAGSLSIFVGGDAADVARVQPWLAAYGRNITHLGDCGAGQAAKSCSQAIFATTIAAWVEVLAYARSIGLDPQQLVAATAGSWADSPVREHVVPHLVRGRAVFGPDDLLQKDLAIVAATAQQHGAEMTLAALAAALLRKPR
jgi:3-hydroxyisobutyrate dehydrogenase-like beta-hydroxyacid dehydrogenase